MNQIETKEVKSPVYDEIWEQQKRKAIVSEIDKNIFVEAGAGAGKTSLIVNRVIHQIKKGIKPEELVVITFTNKAAEELFERITDKLVAEEQKEECEEIKARCTYAIEHIEQMKISTIHSFCFGLLQEQCFEGTLPLDVSVLENEEAEKRKTIFFEQWYAKLLAQDILNMKQTVAEIGYWDAKEFLQTMFWEICEKPGDVHIVTYNDIQIASLKAELDQKKQMAEQLLQQVYGELKDLIDFLVGQINAANGIAKSAEEIMEMEKAYIMSGYKTLFKEVLKQKRISSPKTVKCLYENAATQVCLIKEKALTISCQYWLSTNLCGKTTFTDYLKAKEEAQELAKAYAYFALMKYAVAAKNEYIATLTGQELSNDELLQRAERLINSSESARLYFVEKYKCIYVDEFQDTDHMQASLIWNLALDQDKEHLRPGALFVVGDPKQAIYRFRGGEPAVYYDIKQRMLEMSCEDSNRVLVFELDDNYRSNGEMIDWINQEFRVAFQDSSITYRDMQCKIPKEIPRMNQEHLIPLEGVYKTSMVPPKNKEEAVSAEAQWLGDYIQNLMDGDYGIYETKLQDGKPIARHLRKIQYKDFLILCRGKRDMKKYLTVLEGMQIPVEMSGEIELTQNFGLRNFIKLLQFLLSPADTKAKQGAMHVVMRSKTGMDTKLAKMRLAQMKQEVSKMSSRAVVQYLVKHPEYLIPWDQVVSKAEIASLQSKLRMMTESVLSTTKADSTRLVPAFWEYLDTNQERELALQEDNNAVRFMNVHKVKGLEGNIVILMNRKQMPDSLVSYQELKPDHSYDYYGCFVKYSSNFQGYHAHPYGLEAYQEKGIRSILEETQEFTRLEYVAATRAREVLVVFHEIGKEQCFFGKYKIDSGRNHDHLLGSNGKNVAALGQGVGVKDFKQVISEREACEKKPTLEEETRMSLETYVNLSPSMLEGELKKVQEIAMEKSQEEAQIKAEMVTEVTTLRRPKGNVFGTTMHRSFELLLQRYQQGRWGGEGTEGKKLLQACICQSIMENYEELLAEGQQRYLTKEEEAKEYLEAVKNYLLPVMAGFLKSEKLRKVFENAKEIYTELPFSYYTTKEKDSRLFGEIEPHLKKHGIKIASNQPVWMNGTADLVVVDKDGTVRVIDYKSDSKKEDLAEFEERLKKKYEGQMLLYRYSMSKIFQVPLENVTVELYHLYQEE